MYSKQFEIRWRDLDANGHLGNSSYVDFMSHTRMSFFTEIGIGLEVMKQHQLGPVVLYEHIHYFREVLLGKPITVNLEITGLSEDSRFVRFEHNFYDKNKNNLAFSEMLFTWIDLRTRKLADPNKEILEKIQSYPKAECFEILSKSDIRKHNRRPKDLN